MRIKVRIEAPHSLVREVVVETWGEEERFVGVRRRKHFTQLPEEMEILVEDRKGVTGLRRRHLLRISVPPKSQQPFMLIISEGTLEGGCPKTPPTLRYLFVGPNPTVWEGSFEEMEVGDTAQETRAVFCMAANCPQLSRCELLGSPPGHEAEAVRGEDIQTRRREPPRSTLLSARREDTIRGPKVPAWAPISRPRLSGNWREAGVFASRFCAYLSPAILPEVG